MDEGCFEAIFVIAAVLVVGAAVIGVGVAVAVVAFCASLVWTVTAFLGGYFREQWSLAVSDSLPITTAEPAQIGYFFGPGFSEMRMSSSAGIAATSGPRAAFAQGASSEEFMQKMTGVWSAGGLAGFGVGTVVAQVMTGAPHAALLGVSGAVAVAGRVCFRGLQQLWGAARRIGHPCPKCFARGADPAYQCPNCGTLHKLLWPNVHGVLRHTCRCGVSLPTMGLMGRRQLTARCQDCGATLHGSESADIHLVFAGGPASGKSSLMYMALSQLLESDVTAKVVELLDSGQRPRLDSELRQLAAGQPVSKTVDTIPEPLVLGLMGDGRPIGSSLHVYDMAGEVFLGDDESARHAFYGHVDGLIFVIDPLSTQKSRMEGDTSGIQRESTSTLEPEEAYVRMLKSLDLNTGSGPDAVRSARLAVVLSKADIGGLLGELRTTSEARRESQPDKKRQALSDVQSDTVRQWIMDQGEGNLVRLIESDFRQVRYFAVSALGRSTTEPGRGPFMPVNVLSPFAWSIRGRVSIGADDGE